VRIYDKNNDSGSIHAIGNGKICVYGQGPNIIQIFGKPYTAPIFAGLTVDMNAETERVFNTCIYRHKLENGAAFEDIADAKLPCFVRKITTDKPFIMKLKTIDNLELIRNDSLKIYRAAPGQVVFMQHVIERHQVYIIAAKGDIAITDNEISVGVGESYLYVAGCQDYNEAIEAIEEIQNTPYEDIYNRTVEHWRTFSSRIPKLDDDIAEIADGVGVLIKAQQGDEGGVLAGHYYHMAYFRDQYGVARGLLALGHIEEAKKIMMFYKRIWEKEGKLHNAHGIGVDSVFHVHENDDVEIMGYLIIQAFDLYSANGDKAFLDSLLPMLKWAMEKQIRHIRNNMLPFNGDETYIAGGILGRHAIYHGSAEATLLFIKAGELYCEYTNNSDGFLKYVNDVKSAFKDNFIRDGFIVANNPKYMTIDEYPRFRFGVCEHCYKMYWTEKNANGRYVCPPCAAKVDLPKGSEDERVLPAVALSLFFLNIDFISVDEITPMIDKMVADYETHGSITQSDRITGYDFAFFLYMLVKLNHPLKDEVLKKVIDMPDDSGAWIEYYDKNGNPQESCKCRPWESGMNITAIIEAVSVKG